MKRFPVGKLPSVTSSSVYGVANELLDALLTRREETRWQRLHVPSALRIPAGEHPDQLWFGLEFSDAHQQMAYQRLQHRLHSHEQPPEVPARRCPVVDRLLHRALQEKIRVGLLTLHVTSEQLVWNFLAYLACVSVERMELIETDLEDLLKAVGELQPSHLRLRHSQPQDVLELLKVADELQKEANAELLLIVGMEQLPLGGTDIADRSELEWRLRKLSLHWDARLVLIEQGLPAGT